MFATLSTGGSGHIGYSVTDSANCAAVSPSAIGMISAVLGAVGPQAEAVRVSVSGPHCLWTAHAYGPGRGKIPLLLEVEQAVACWVAGDLPGLDRCPQRDVNLATGRIAPVGRLVAAVR